MRSILKHVLKLFARLTLWRYKPKVIGITGNVGKTSTKEAVYAVVSSAYRSRKGEKSFNNEFGVPLTILGIPSGGRNPLLWLWGLARSATALVYTRYPEVLVLEMGVDRPGDMEYLLSVVRPDVAVFTSVGDVPVHVEHFLSREALIQEKLKLASAVPEGGKVIINADVPAWGKVKVKASVFTYGFSEGVDVKIHSPEYRFVEKNGRKIPVGMSLKLEHGKNVVPFRLDGVFSAQSGAYVAAASCATGLALDFNMVEASSALQKYAHPKGRLMLLDGIRDSLILDDTYNASPSSAEAALHALSELPGERKIAALGDMLELGEYSEEAHREIGKAAAQACDILILVGARMRFAADEAVAHGFAEGENLFSFDTAEEAGRLLLKTLKDGDLVLLKGSQGMRMEKAVKEIMAHPEKAEEFLVRQEDSWLKV